MWLRLALVALCVAACLGASPAIAQPADVAPAVADEADVEFRLGNDAYARGDYQRALGHYFASYRLVPNRNVLFNVAKCYESGGQLVEAHRYYSMYLQGLDGTEQKAVSTALERIGRKLGTVSITSTPPGAAIYLDRKNLGEYARTPAQIVLKPGAYDVIVEREGWLPHILKDVQVVAGGQSNHVVALTRRDGNVRAQGKPARAQLQLLPDGDPQAIDGDTLVSLPLGKQRVRIWADDFVAAVIDVDVSPSQTSIIKYSLAAQSGSLAVRTTEPGASIYVDGDLVGFAPAVIPIPVGPHNVVVRAEGFEPFQQQVDVPLDGRVDIDAALTGVDEVAAASRASESLRDAPASVSLIGSREIAAFGYTGTADALQGTRGIYFTNDLTYHVVGMRGYAPFSQFGNRTLVLVDGHAINDSWAEASFHEFELSSDLFGYDRIELVRGPTSVVYGSGAFQGVVSLVSPEIKDTFATSRVGMGAADDGVVRGYAHVRQATENGGVQASVASVQGQPRTFVSPIREAAGDESVARRVGATEAYTARLNAVWHDFTWYSLFHSRDRQTPTAAYETIFGDPRTHESDTRAFGDLRHRLALGETAALENRVFVDYYGFLGQFAYPRADGGVSTDRFDGVWTGFESRLELQLFDGATWTTGIEAVRHVLHRTRGEDEDGPTTNIDAPFWKTALSTSLRYDLNPRISFWAGARYDLWSFDSLPDPDGVPADGAVIQNANPRVVALLRPIESGTLKVIGARGFRAPSVYELTYNDAGRTQIPSPALTPESIWSAELEYSQRLFEQFDGIVATYAQQIRNRIEAQGAGDMVDPLHYENLDEKLWSGGLDFELRRPFFHGWMASAVFSYQRTRPGTVGSLFEAGANVPNSPRTGAALKLVVPIIARSLRLANRVVFEGPRIDRDGQQTTSAVKWDLVFSGEATPLALRWSFGVRNLLDWQIEHPVGDEILDPRIAQAGRTFAADIAFIF